MPRYSNISSTWGCIACWPVSKLERVTFETSYWRCIGRCSWTHCIHTTIKFRAMLLLLMYILRMQGRGDWWHCSALRSNDLLCVNRTIDCTIQRTSSALISRDEWTTGSSSLKLSFPLLTAKNLSKNFNITFTIEIKSFSYMKFVILLGYNIYNYPFEEDIRHTVFPLSPLRLFPTAFTFVPRARLSTLVESNV